MKIGLYGGLANNCYVFAKALTKEGLDVIFIRDRSDTYAFSQPVWEDAEFVLDYNSVSNSFQFSWDYWALTEERLGWQSPSWLVDPLASLMIGHNGFSGRSWVDALGRRYVRAARHRSGVVSSMRTCDVLLVCGVEATILAMLSGRPYIIWPHGGDIRMAAGLVRSPRRPRHFIRFHFQKLLLTLAYDRSVAVGTHDPKGIGGSIGSVRKALKITRFEHLPIPMALVARLDKEKRREMLDVLCSRLNIPIITADFIGIVASRIDFDWKGHDLLLSALQRVPHNQKLHLIFSGWGKNYLDAQNYITTHNLGDRVTFLPFSLSKPILSEFFAVCDFAVDQFKSMGTYGTALVEAMAAGCPVLTWIDQGAFASKGWEAPPVINAVNEDEILLRLERIAAGTEDLSNISRSSQEWISRVHAPDTVAEKVREIFKSDHLAS